MVTNKYSKPMGGWSEPKSINENTWEENKILMGQHLNCHFIA